MPALSTESLTWYWNRLSCMPIGEIGYRVNNILCAILEEHGWFLVPTAPAADLSVTSKNWVTAQDKKFKSDYCKAADQIIDGHLSIFAHNNLVIGHPPEWNKNPLSGENSPLAFGKTLNYRDESIVGDIKYMWEPSRHLQLVTLAQAYATSLELKYLSALKTQLTSWFDQCPYMMGVHWSSSLELGIRLINWSIIWQLIGGLDSPIFKSTDGCKFRDRWLCSIYQHAHFIKGHLSKYSSANNHLIGELSGLFIATLTWPHWKIFSKWQEDSKDALVHEALSQNDSDGVNREQTTSYQQFVLDFMILSGLAANENAVDLSPEYWERIELMLEYLASIMDVSGHVPMIGDADDGLVLRLSLEESWCPYRSLLALGGIIFNREDFIIKGLKDDKCNWLKGFLYKSKFNKINQKRSFPHAGYHVVGNHFDTDNEIRLIVDSGSLGFQGIAAHGHADALSIVLNYAGREFFIDPGTYSYHTQKRWREYFRGTSAHNTVQIDGCSQSVSGGNFMWLHKANARCISWLSNVEEDYFLGEHDGYSRLEAPLIHKREIIFLKEKRELSIVDYLEGKGEHQVDLFWHFSEDCMVVKNGSKTIVSNNGKRISILIPDSDIEKSIHFGDDTTPLGWVSRQYDKKTPCNTLKCSTHIKGNSSITTLIKFD